MMQDDVHTFDLQRVRRQTWLSHWTSHATDLKSRHNAEALTHSAILALDTSITMKHSQETRSLCKDS